jgi:hypothetical protein
MLLGTVSQLYSEKPKRTLYHYTSLTGLMGIVEHRNFWVSDIRYLKRRRRAETPWNVAQR